MMQRYDLSMPGHSAPTSRSHARIARGLRAFTLMEALVAAVVVAMVAASAAVAVSVGIATQQENRLAVLAMHAAELQMSSCMEADYDDMDDLAGTENAGELLAPARPGSTERPLLPASFSELSRITTVTASTKTFTQYNNVQVVGKTIQVDVMGPNNTLLARLIRFRGLEDQL
jgi:type II secretory pathway pseudopilin PulG